MKRHKNIQAKAKNSIKTTKQTHKNALKSVFKAPLFIIGNKYIHIVGVDGGRCVTTQSFTR